MDTAGERDRARGRRALSVSLVLPLMLAGAAGVRAVIADVSKPTPTPSPRWGAGVAFDATRGRVLLFGGYTSTGGTLADTWSWDGSRWAQQQPAQSPPAVQHPQLVYDGVTRHVLLFDRDPTHGESPLDYQSVWAWDGATWSQDGGWAQSHTPNAGPLGWDDGRGRVVLAEVSSPFASVAPTKRGRFVPWLPPSRTRGFALRELEWDGARWQPGAAEQPVDGSTRVQAAAWEPGMRRMLVLAATERVLRPPPPTIPGSPPGPPGSQRRPPTVIPAHSDMVQFVPSESAPSTCGGDVVAMEMTAWELGDAGWSPVSAAGLPCELGQETLLSDPTDGRAMLVGSRFLWKFTGQRWQRSPLIPAMAGRTGVALVGDAQHRQVVAIGGLRGSAAGSDTWTWDGHQWLQRGGMPAPAARTTAAAPADRPRGSSTPNR